MPVILIHFLQMGLNKSLFFLLCVSFVLSSCSNNRKKVTALQLVKIYHVETNNQLEPSGLTFWNNNFYTVSDKSDFIYQLKFDKDSIKLDPVIKIKNERGTKLDFEGITHDDKFFYLISEKYFQILKVSLDGSQQTWMPSDSTLKNVGLDAGLFQTFNANFEGICHISDQQFLLAAERQPRGFVTADFSHNKHNAYLVDKPIYYYENDVSPDFTGLSCNKEGVFVLDRNAYMVAKLYKSKGRYEEGMGYSYKSIVNQPQLRYQDMKYGHAEGLVVEGNKMYIILDNNRNYHENNDNNNSLFIVLEF